MRALRIYLDELLRFKSLCGITVDDVWLCVLSYFTKFRSPVSVGLFAALAALDLQMDCADVLLQGAGRPERHAFAVAAGVVSALLVHRLGVLLWAVWLKVASYRWFDRITLTPRTSTGHLRCRHCSR